jgi:hypothetical protein
VDHQRNGVLRFYEKADDLHNLFYFLNCSGYLLSRVTDPHQRLEDELSVFGDAVLPDQQGVLELVQSASFGLASVLELGGLENCLS